MNAKHPAEQQAAVTLCLETDISDRCADHEIDRVANRCRLQNIAEGHSVAERAADNQPSDEKPPSQTPASTGPAYLAVVLDGGVHEDCQPLLRVLHLTGATNSSTTFAYALQPIVSCCAKPRTQNA
jgi:hypothetical protein